METRFFVSVIVFMVCVLLMVIPLILRVNRLEKQVDYIEDRRYNTEIANDSLYRSNSSMRSVSNVSIPSNGIRAKSRVFPQSNIHEENYKDTVR